MIVKYLYVKSFLLILLLISQSSGICAQEFMTNVYGRNTISLNGDWQHITDWYDRGYKEGIYKDDAPKDKNDFREYGFSTETLSVPRDWNSQYTHLKYYEGSMWYKKDFSYQVKKDKRVFLYFGGVNYIADVYLNGELVGSHEGGFTPFQFEISKWVKEGDNKVILRVNNQRQKDGIPALNYDWWNYGGITRDVFLIETPASFIQDYFIQLKKGTNNIIEGWVKLDGATTNEKINIQIAEAGINESFETDNKGLARFSIKKDVKLWSTDEPFLHQVNVSSAYDAVTEQIGFRTIEVKGADILLNGKSVFLKGISFHEEIASGKRRASTEEDALVLLREAKALGANFIRLAHYPQNEHIVRLAEQMGFMMWEEIPIWQGIEFTNPVILSKAKTMLQEMVQRDKNRCGIIIWSLSNETSPSPERNRVLTDMAALCRSMDDTRLVSSAFDKFKYEGNKIIIEDSLSHVLDVLAVNKYMGWYMAWPGESGDITWESNFEKPLIVSEFGGEAKYGNHGSAEIANDWTEEHQEKLYKDNIAMFKKTPLLRGTCPWILVDFRTPYRMNPKYQQGWNRKGLISEEGKRKKAWYVMKEFYDGIE